VVSSDGGAPCSTPRVDVQRLQGFSKHQNQQAAAATAPQTRGVLRLWRELSAGLPRVSDFAVKNSGSTGDYL
jgi:hypothetical protein